MTTQKFRNGDDIELQAQSFSTECTHIVWSAVNLTQFVGFTVTDTLYVEMQNVLEPWPHHVQQCLPVPVNAESEYLSLWTHYTQCCGITVPLKITLISCHPSSVCQYGITVVVCIIVSMNMVSQYQNTCQGLL